MIEPKRLSGADAAQLASTAGRIRLSHSDGAKYHCPMDDSSAVLLAFAYPNRPDVDLWLHDSGCSSTGNGVIRTATGYPLTEAVDRLSHRPDPFAPSTSSG